MAGSTGGRRGRPGRIGRLAAAFVLAVGAGAGVVGLTAGPAYAADDQIDSFTVDYTVQPSGVLQVKETLVWRFGSNSGRHGILRNLVTREKYDDKQDAVYGITNIDVDASGGNSSQFSTSTTEEQGGREKELVIKIGDPDRTVSTPTATYTISYDVTGAMRSFPNENPPYDEFFWDASGTGNPAIKKFTATATVPGGAQDVSCFAGPIGTKNECTGKSFDKGGKATFTQDNLAAGDNVSLGVKITPGLVSDNQPHLEPDGSKLSAAEKVGLAVLGVGGVACLAGAPLVGALWWRRNGRDKRYAGLAPGTVPLAGQEAHIVPSDPDIPIPVSFSPPRIPVAEAGLLADGQVDTRETAATIIDLAVRGVLRVESQGDDDFRVTLLDPNRAAAPHETVLLEGLFSGEGPGAVRDLSTPGSLTTAHTSMVEAVRDQVAARGWFTNVPKARAAGSAGIGVIFFAIVAGFVISKVIFLLILLIAPILITVAVIRRKLRRGQRTADGRAVCDQVEGFRTYLATAEADQLKFEEGEDIFSKYLPWAIIFELTDRWAKLCADLVALGRIPDVTPYWYSGNYYNLTSFNIGFLTGSLTSAATPVASSGSSGTGAGGGSSFSGGGFSGGGGGGGGSSSW